MLSRAAVTAEGSDFLFISNHSYGYIAGWARTGQNSPAYVWYGGAEKDIRFGQYNVFARDSDAIAYAAPYYLMFRSAGNDRTENPIAGDIVQLSPSNSTTVAYDPTIHPAGDGFYRNGYNTVSFDATAKNVITIGSVSDAVQSGERDILAAGISAFSSWGPTDDGRIKPDLVANGELLYSTLSGTSSSYGRLSGTSMSSPNAAGAAALLIQKYQRLFPGQAMRASTLKGLLIHTADDIGPPGPDYQSGWGLLNVQAAADTIRNHAENSGFKSIIESQLNRENFVEVYEFVWDGVSPIQITLAWTDPPGSATTSSDVRSPRLRNNLDLKVQDPEMFEYFPYIMPFVGDWTLESMAALATTGVNNTDNVEQVFIKSPGQAGVYRVIVSHQGSLVDEKQNYSLFISGSSGEEPAPADLAVFGISPTFASIGDKVTFKLSGLALDTVLGVHLQRPGHGDIQAENLRLEGNELIGLFDLNEVSAGFWSVVVFSDERSILLQQKFEILAALLSQDFNTNIDGWAFDPIIGSNSWFVTDAGAHSPPESAFSPGPASATTTRLISPEVEIPATSTGLQLIFWHHFELQSGQDGGRLEVSLNGLPWVGSDAAGAGLTIVSNDYNTSMRNSGPPQNRSSFAGQRAWSGNSGGFIETVVKIDSEIYAGQRVRFGWTIATNGSVASPGWFVDSISLTTEGSQQSSPPLFSADPVVIGAEIIEEDETFWSIVRGISANINAVAAASSEGGEIAAYSWSSSRPTEVFFSENNTLDAAQTTATFEALGDYELTVTATDTAGLSTLATVFVRVSAVASDIRISPPSATLTIFENQLFTAKMLDQFDGMIAEQPEQFEWMTSGGGSIDSSGLLITEQVGENFRISATAEVPAQFTAEDSKILIQSSLSKTALVNVNPALADIELLDLVQLFDNTPKQPTIVTNPPNLAVVVSYNDNPEAPSAPGSYSVEVNIDELNFQGSIKAVFSIISQPMFSEDPVVAGAEIIEEDETFWSIVRGISANINAVATASSEGSAIAAYSWSASRPAEVSFSENNTLDAAQTTATFEAPGDYELTVTATDTDGLSTPATVFIRVVAVASDIRVSPASATLTIFESQQFSAEMVDQFDGLVAEQPQQFEWMTSGGGSIDNSGLLTTDQVGEHFRIFAMAEVPAGFIAEDSEIIIQSSLSKTALVNVNPALANIELFDLVQLFDNTPRQPIIVTDPPNLTVVVTYNGKPEAPSAPGSYSVEVIIDEQNFKGSRATLFSIRSPTEASPGYTAWQNHFFGPESADDPIAAPNADADGDGLINLVEFYLGTDPTDPYSKLHIRIVSVDLLEGALTLRIEPVNTRGDFRVEQSPALFENEPARYPLKVEIDQIWTEIELPYTDTADFYRAVYTLPPLD